MIKYYDQKQESILAYGTKEGVHAGQEGMRAGLADHTSSAHREARVPTLSVERCELTAHPQGRSSSSHASFAESSRTSPKQWVPKPAEDS